MLSENTIEKELGLRYYRHKLKLQKYDLKRPLRLIDYATCIYLGTLGLVLIFSHRGVSHWPLLSLGHFISISLLLYFIKYAEKNPLKILKFFRDCYPFFLYPFFFKEVNIIINIFFPFWLEPWLIKWDYFLFDSHPTVWIQKFYQPWLTEIMAFSYWSYYVLIPFGGFVLYLRKNKTLFHSFVFSLSLSLYICYFSFLFLTARGPHETLVYLHSERALVGFFDIFVKIIQDNASISGAAFPSSHVAAVWVVIIYLFKHKKIMGWLLLPLIISLSFSVVYMQYHYAVDSIAGIFLVCLTYPLGRYLENIFKKKKERTMYNRML